MRQAAVGPGAVLNDLARHARTVGASASCAEVDACFSSDASLATVVVVGAGPRDWALLDRSLFNIAMTGRFGFGRALHSQRPVSELADWNPLLLGPQVSVEAAAESALARPDPHRYQDVLTWIGDEPALVSAAAVFTVLAAEYEHRAHHEPLTGLANRDLFLRRLDAACAVVDKGAEGRVGVMYIDLDRFKTINDTYGHGAGDRVLTAVAERLAAGVRPGDTIARLGGDEFAVLLDLQGAIDHAVLAGGLGQLGARLLEALREPVHYGERVIIPAASIGISTSAVGIAHAETLLREADLAMYAAKREGGRKVRLVGEVGRSLAVPGVTSVDDSIVLGLQAGQFRVHYQPIVHLPTGRVISMEALVRWQHPHQGLLFPADFLPAAEANGAVVAIGGWVLETACHQLAEWDRQHLDDAPRFVNVNVSVRQLLDTHLLDQVNAALTSSGLAPSRLRLELPETATMEQLELARPVLARLRSSGVKLTLDDVGAGANSLRHLSSLEVDGIKIDRSFVDSMLTDRRDMAVVRMLIELGNALGVAITAEGVETVEQRAALLDLGCTWGQGYLFGRPLPPTEVANLSIGT